MKKSDEKETYKTTTEEERDGSGDNKKHKNIKIINNYLYINKTRTKHKL
jgi:hypothetical protein